ncbi:MAG: ABC transporter ATP-binding protein/permease [Clostridia bacterium]|nr:ABC transporter ATP-binding protein/permease [Clostridia bacterium]
MIKVQDLTKIYKSKNRTNCMALDHVSFTLEDSGMVFVLGKSGSGKSTLLNLLGGLDEFEEGEIFFENEQLSKFTKYDFYDYRCRHIGFVFQDFHLLEELTVEENIALVLDLESAEHGDLIVNALQKVGLQEYASRYPRELSGGQKQRVAMARAIVKNPEVILCDEPTGNLDADNSRQILNLLKEFSKTKLVIIVSHNIPDAENYADRILELRDGKIVRDDIRREGYSNAFSVNEEGILVLPYNKTLSGEQIDEMVEGIRAGDVKKVIQNDDGFRGIDSKKMELRGRPYSRRNSGMSFKKTMFLTRTMMSGKFARFLVAAITATLIVSCFAVFQSFLNYGVNTSLSNSMIANNEPVIAYQKATISGGTKMLDVTSLVHITEEDFAAFRNTVYGDRMHVLYDHAMPIKTGVSDTVGAKRRYDAASNVTDFYIRETYGVLQCDMELLKHLFGEDIENRVLKGSLDRPNNGIIITDYVADSILEGNSARYKDYDSIIGVYYSPGGNKYGVVDAIIDTGYHQKYDDLKARMDALKENEDKDGLKALRDSDEFLHFAEYVQLVLGVSYTFSTDYIADMSTSLDYLSIGIPASLSFNSGDGEYQPLTSPRIYPDTGYQVSVTKGEAVLTTALYNSMVGSKGTQYNKDNLDEFTPIDITVTFYSRNKDVLGERTFHVSRLTYSSNSRVYLDEEDFLAARPLMTSPYAIYFDDVRAATTLNDIASERNFVVKNVENDMATKLYRLIVTFSDLFRLFEAFLLAICIIYLCAFGSNVIQRHKYQVGIIKSLGGKTIQIASIFLAQPLVVGALIIALSGFGIWGATSVANTILLNSMQTHMELEIRMFDIIEFYPHLAIVDLALVVLITMVSAFAPVWAIHNIKPINIIKAKE